MPLLRAAPSPALRRGAPRWRPAPPPRRPCGPWTRRPPPRSRPARALGEHALERAAQHALAVVGRDDDGDRNGGPVVAGLPFAAGACGTPLGSRRPSSKAQTVSGLRLARMASSRRPRRASTPRARSCRRSRRQAEQPARREGAGMAVVHPGGAGAHACALAQQLGQLAAARVHHRGLLARLDLPAGLAQPEADVGVPAGADVVPEAAHLLEGRAADGAVGRLRVGEAAAAQRVGLAHRAEQRGEAGRRRRVAAGGLVLDRSAETPTRPLGASAR